MDRERWRVRGKGVCVWRGRSVGVYVQRCVCGGQGDSLWESGLVKWDEIHRVGGIGCVIRQWIVDESPQE